MAVFIVFRIWVDGSADDVLRMHWQQKKIKLKERGIIKIGKETLITKIKNDKEKRKQLTNSQQRIKPRLAYNKTTAKYLTAI